MTHSFSRFAEFVPGATRRARAGIGLIFAVFFYLYGFVLVFRAGSLAELWNGGVSDDRRDAVVIVLVWGLLYLASLLIPRVLGPGGRRWTRGFLRRFWAYPPAAVGLWLFLTIACIGVNAPLLSTADPTAQESPSLTRYQPPSLSHPMGTDKFGRDVWSRLAHGSRVSLSVGLISVVLSVLLGTLVGAFSGFVGGWVDEIVMRIVDGLLSFPRLLFVLTLVALFSNSYLLLILVIATTGWMGVARLVRGDILRLKEREFIQAAVATGIGRARLVARHLLPNSLGPVVVTATLNVGAVILLESYLSFLGLGIQPPLPSWGGMVYDGREVLLTAWWVSAFPAAAIVVSVVACNLVGDGVRDAMQMHPSETSEGG